MVRRLTSGLGRGERSTGVPMDRAPTRKAWLRPCLVPDRRSTQPLELAIRHSERQRHTGSGRRSGDCVERAVVGAVEARSAHENEAARRRGPLVNDVPFAVGAEGEGGGASVVKIAISRL